MTFQQDDEADSGLILAAEECPPERFAQFHSFSSYDDAIIRKLSAHGPVLIRGGRGSGKSALLLEAYRRMRGGESTFPVYVSLRYLPLLRSDGQEYIGHFCILLSGAIKKEIEERNLDCDFGITSDQVSIQLGLTRLSQDIGKRIVLLFDDAAHIGREKPLEVFFDLFRTLSSNLTACKASIYPGVTKFGIRFDVFNDSTVVDIGRSDVSSFSNFFPDVVQARYPKLAERSTFSDRLSPQQFANLLGRAVVGNLRGFILACNRFEEMDRIGIPELTKCILDMATDYYWPLMEEVAPKLGVYEPLIEPARDVVEIIVEHACKPVKDRNRSTLIAQDRVLIHRHIVAQYSKIFEILEYLGFVARREASRAMKSGGRGPVFAVNLCNILDCIPSKRLTFEMIEEWIGGALEPAELHSSGQAFNGIKLPALPDEDGLAILGRPVKVLSKSLAYPYGLTSSMIEKLEGAGIITVGDLADVSDDRLYRIKNIGPITIKRIRDVVYQAIWM
ncbi:helix-hairpin-helix domain-containing protein [Azospirillum cavernae]|uniref:helix-hairpin-helix domain-containing protein n=1 Tax=Azospirillum cavernae TaxID=2320860 RepID=UPI0011C47C07|nr:helix-hairpin-helix domain-containing protein [Azospirillum cavernae]